MKSPYKKTAEQDSGEKPKLRLVHTINHDNGRTAKVYRDIGWSGYRIKFYQRNISGKLQYLNKADQVLKKADYYTDDKQEAVSTAEYWCNRPDTVCYAQA